MPFFDRFWWLRAAAAALAGAMAVVFPWRYLALALPLDHRLGISSQDDVWIAFGMTAALAVLAFVLGIGAYRARQRDIWRRGVLTGEDKVQYPDAHQYQADLPPHESDPFVLTWRISRNSLVFGRLAVVPVITLGCISLGLFAWLSAALATVLFGDVRAFTSIHADLTLAAISFFVCLFITWAFGSLMLDGLGRSPSIAVDQHGITWHSRWRQTRMVRWSDALLLEYATFHRVQDRSITSSEKYTLYGHETSIRWTNQKSPEATEQQREQLLAVIYHYTGLLPAQLVQDRAPWQRNSARWHHGA